MNNELSKAKQLAIEAVRAAGKIHKEMFSTDIIIEEKGEFGDVVTEADHWAEQAISRILSHEFPDHLIRSEETGWHGVESDWLWLVDPLDGTNNFAIGLPVFGVAITLIHKNEPVLGVIYDSVLDKLYVTEKGKGSSLNHNPIIAKTKLKEKHDPLKMTVGWIQGHQVQKERSALKLKQYLDTQFKRVLRLWAPSLLWCALAKGDIDGIVLYNSEGDDLYAGILMVKEAGGIVIDFEGNPFEGMHV